MTLSEQAKKRFFDEILLKDNNQNFLLQNYKFNPTYAIDKKSNGQLLKWLNMKINGLRIDLKITPENIEKIICDFHFYVLNKKNVLYL